MRIGKENFRNYSPHTYFKIFPFQCVCGCQQYAFMEYCTRVDNYGWYYYILGHYERLIDRCIQENPKIPVCPNCKANYYVSGFIGTYICHRCHHNF